MAQNEEYQNLKEKEPYYDNREQTEILRTGKCCFKIYNLGHILTLRQERDTKLWLKQYLYASFVYVTIS